ncbi:MAG TPA: hypothetical protein VGR91_05310 [Stellaceae bacterium]|nr:hypothetical protein [Stellaceae bacterium]
MRKLLIAAVLGGVMFVSPLGGFALAKGHPHHATPHAAAHTAAHVDHDGHTHRAARPFDGGAHPDWDRHAERWHHHGRLPFIIFGVLSAMLARQ